MLDCIFPENDTCKTLVVELCRRFKITTFLLLFSIYTNNIIVDKKVNVPPCRSGTFLYILRKNALPVQRFWKTWKGLFKILSSGLSNGFCIACTYCSIDIGNGVGANFVDQIRWTTWRILKTATASNNRPCINAFYIVVQQLNAAFAD